MASWPRRVVPPLLVTGAALLVAALIWPTDRMTVQLPGGAVVPLLDIWLWGRVRSLSELSVTEVDGSVGVLIALVLAAALAVAAAVAWLGVPRGRAGRQVRGSLAVVGVFAAIATAAVAVSADAGSAFGWFSPGGPPTFTRTVVGAFPTVVFLLWALALLAMVAVLLRRRGGPDESPGEPSSA